MKISAALAFCVAFAACSSQPKPSAPVGPYHFESTEPNVTIESTVKFRYAADAAVVDEDVQFGPVTAHVENRLDPKTYSAIAYRLLNDPEGEDPSITVSSDGASFKTKRGQAIARAPAPGAPSWVFGNYASSFVVLPLLVGATHAKNVNAYMTSVFRGKAFAFKLSVNRAATAPRPTAVPAGDASISLGSANPRKPISMVTVWYDPVSLVVDRVSLGGATAFVRKP